MDTTDWDLYGTGAYEKCANCMAHCGYEPTAAQAMMEHPLQAAMIAWKGIKTEGPMAPEISLDAQRPAQYVFDGQVQLTLSQMRANEAREKAAKAAAKEANKSRRRLRPARRSYSPSPRGDGDITSPTPRSRALPLLRLR